MQKQDSSQSIALDKQRSSCKLLDQKVRKIRKEEIGSEEDSNSRVTTLESFDFKDVWNFNHPYMSVKECQKKLRQVEVFVEKGVFQAFQEEERNDCNYVLESSLLRVWEYTKAKQEKRFVLYNF